MPQLWDLKIIDFRHSQLQVDIEIAKLKRNLNLAKGDKKDAISADIKKLEDKKAEQIASGRYEFVEGQKFYVDYNGKSISKPPYFFSWCRDTKPDRDSWFFDLGFTPVKVGEQFAPDNLGPSGNEYIFGDLVLVRRDITRQVRERLEEVMLAKSGADNKFNAIKNELNNHGALVQPTQAELEAMIPRIAS